MPCVELNQIFQALFWLHSGATWVGDFLRGVTDPGWLQAAVTGGIAFSIPVLWDSVREINDARSRPVEKGPNHVLNRVYYQKLEWGFRYQALMPSAILAGIGLLAAPYFPVPVNFVTVFCILFWFLSLAWVIDSIRKRNKKSLLQFINQEDSTSTDLKEILLSLWELDLRKLASEFGVNETSIFVAMLRHINALLLDSEPNVALGLIRDFAGTVDRRSVEFLTWQSDVVSGLLKVRRDAWVVERRLLEETQTNKSKAVLSDWSNYDSIVRDIDASLLRIQRKLLEESQPYTYFSALEKHFTENLADDRYINMFLDILGREMLEQLGGRDNRFSSWENFFPSSWFITNKNLKGDAYSVAKGWNKLYLGWARDRIWEGEDYDTVLESVTRNLFPEFDPMLFADFLTFLVTPYSEGHRIAALASGHKIFGLIGRIYTFDGSESDAVTNQKVSEERKLAEDETVRYFLGLASVQQRLNCEVIKECRAEIAGLRKNPNGVASNLIQPWENFINGTAEYLGCDKTAGKKN